MQAPRLCSADVEAGHLVDDKGADTCDGALVPQTDVSVSHGHAPPGTARTHDAFEVVQ